MQKRKKNKYLDIVKIMLTYLFFYKNAKQMYFH